MTQQKILFSIGAAVFAGIVLWVKGPESLRVYLIAGYAAFCGITVLALFYIAAIESRQAAKYALNKLSEYVVGIACVVIVSALIVLGYWSNGSTGTHQYQDESEYQQRPAIRR